MIACVQTYFGTIYFFDIDLLPFKLKPYVLIWSKSMIDGSQCALLCHAENTKTSRIDPKFASDIIKVLESKFGKMTVARGKK